MTPAESRWGRKLQYGRKVGLAVAGEEPRRLPSESAGRSAPALLVSPTPYFSEA